MKKLHNFAGIVALLCFMIPSTFGQNTYFGKLKYGVARSEAIDFGARSDSRIFVSAIGTLDSLRAVYIPEFWTIRLYAFSKDSIDIHGDDWQNATAQLNYYCTVDPSDTAMLSTYKRYDISVMHLPGESRERPFITIQAPLMIIDQSRPNTEVHEYGCILELSIDQILFLEKIKAVPGKSTGVKLVSLRKT